MERPKSIIKDFPNLGQLTNHFSFPNLVKMNPAFVPYVRKQYRINCILFSLYGYLYVLDLFALFIDY